MAKIPRREVLGNGKEMETRIKNHIKNAQDQYGKPATRLRGIVVCEMTWRNFVLVITINSVSKEKLASFFGILF